MDDLVARTLRGRAAKQERSERTRNAIVEAVIALLAEGGVGGLTHRLVARRAGASLAATTYYFETKQDMLAEASNALLRAHLAQVSALSAGATDLPPFRGVVAQLAADAIGVHSARALAWCEVVLDSARHPTARTLARAWFDRIAEAWEGLARASGVPEPAKAARSGMDIFVGALFHSLGLGLERQALWTALAGCAPALPPLGGAPAAAPPLQGDTLSPKAAATRERILDAAIRLLASRGAGAVNFRAAALEAGLTAGAPAYHFASAETLLAEAQRLLFARSQARYSRAMGGAFRSYDLAEMAELLAVIFQSEVTEHGPTNLATYGIWLQGAREPELREDVRRVLAGHHDAWRRILARVGAPTDGPAPYVIQNLFAGAQIRAMAAGVTPDDLVQIRLRLRDDLADLVAGRHWMQQPIG